MKPDSGRADVNAVSILEDANESMKLAFLFRDPTRSTPRTSLQSAPHSNTIDAHDLVPQSDCVRTNVASHGEGWNPTNTSRPTLLFLLGQVLSLGLNAPDDLGGVARRRRRGEEGVEELPQHKKFIL